MNILANKSLVFLANRYEEWSGGMCLSQGPINAEITATAGAESISFEVTGAESLRMNKQASFALISDAGMSMDIGTRLQYFNPFFREGDPLNIILCQVFYEGRTISYIRFAMSWPDRIIEFYGNTISFDGLSRPEAEQGKRLPSFKRIFIDDIASQYRLLLKDNTVNPAVIDHQLACVAYSAKVFLKINAMTEDNDDVFKEQVFRDVSSIISEFYSLFIGGALNIAKDWYNYVVDNPIRAEKFVEYYYTKLDAGQTIDGFEFQRKFMLP